MHYIAIYWCHWTKYHAKEDGEDKTGKPGEKDNASDQGKCLDGLQVGEQFGLLSDHFRYTAEGQAFIGLAGLMGNHGMEDDDGESDDNAMTEQHNQPHPSVDHIVLAKYSCKEATTVG